MRFQFNGRTGRFDRPDIGSNPVKRAVGWYVSG